jgi:hypothetical protein
MASPPYSPPYLPDSPPFFYDDGWMQEPIPPSPLDIMPSPPYEPGWVHPRLSPASPPYESLAPQKKRPKSKSKTKKSKKTKSKKTPKNPE